MAASSVDIHVSSDDLRQMYVALKGVEGNLRVALRRELKASGDEGAAAVRAAASWSKRIPGAVKVDVSFSTKQTGVSVVVDAKKAPEARPLENGGKSGTFRHRVFGSDVWVEQKARPYFYASQTRRSPAVEARVRKAMDEAALRAGFTGP